MGEIGIDRREYLYVLSGWEIAAIVRGYRRRTRPLWEMARLVAYQAHYAMGVGKGQKAKGLTEWLPFPWEGRRAETGDGPTKEERERLLRMIREENERRLKG